MEWIKNRVIKIWKWNKNYCSILLKNKIYLFLGGQFIKLAFKINNKFDYRFYSFINSNKDKKLEFFFKKIKNSYFSNLLFNLIPNDKIYISKYSYGNFIIKNVSKKNILWMLSIGTSISPLLSILKSDFFYIKNNFKKIFFLYGVKYINNIFYLNDLLYLRKKYGFNYLNLFFSISREKKNINKKKLNFIYGYINNFFSMKLLGKYIDNNSHFMISGNFEMVNNIYNILKNNFLIKKKNISVEKY